MTKVICRDSGIEFESRDKIMTDTFRKEYKQLSDEAKEHIAFIKEKADNLLHEFNMCTNLELNPDARMMTFAKTNLEQAIMWAVKAIT